MSARAATSRSEGPEHDEMLFIVIHQVYELWFKQVLHEVDHAIALLEAREAHRVSTRSSAFYHPESAGGAARHLETMTPLEFSRFARGWRRERFQSISFDNSNCVGNNRRPRSIASPQAHRARSALEQRFGKATVGRVPAVLVARRLRRATNAVARDVTSRIEPSPEYRRPDEVYRKDATPEMCERLVDLDEESRSGAIAMSSGATNDRRADGYRRSSGAQ